MPPQEKAGFTEKVLQKLQGRPSTVSQRHNQAHASGVLHAHDCVQAQMKPTPGSKLRPSLAQNSWPAVLQGGTHREIHQRGGTQELKRTGFTGGSLEHRPSPVGPRWV